MAKISIPRNILPTFKLFIELNENEKDKLLNEIKKVNIDKSRVEMSQELSLTLNIDEKNIEVILDMIFTLINVREDTNLSISEFVDELISALKETDVVLGDQENSLRKHFSDIFSSGSNYLNLAKAQFASWEKDRILIDAKIIPDIRPIFNDENKPVGSVMIFNLKIEYQQDNKLKEVYLSTDLKDLVELKKLIEGMEEKDKILKSLYMGNGIKIIEIK